jgi:nicotinate-nucleotide adenylyltransferase
MPVWYLVPDGVVQYIEKRQLYRSRGVAGPAAREPVSRGGGAVASAGHPTYDRPPAAADPDGPPTEPPSPHLQEVPR